MVRPAKTIAHILPWPSVGGTEQATLRLARAVASSYRSKIFCLSDAHAVSRMFSDEGFETVPYRPITPSYRHLNRFLRDSYALSQEFKRNEIGVVHCADVLAGFYAAVAGRMANLPVLCHVRNRYEDLRRHDALFLRAVNKFIFVSHDTRRRFACRVSPRKAQIIHDGIRVPRGVSDPSAAHETRKTVRAEFGLPERTKIVGMVARVAPQKDYETLAHAAATIAAVHPYVRFLIVGDNSLEQVHREHYLKIKHALVELGVDPLFVFTGFRRDVGRLIAAMDVFVLSTHLEGFPLVILEALARAKPVVATAVDGIPEIIVDGVTGRLFAPRDYQGLAAQVISLLDSEEYAVRLGEAGRSTVESDFSSERFAASMLDLYDRVLHCQASQFAGAQHTPTNFKVQKSMANE